jgi:hypothetical protein
MLQEALDTALEELAEDARGYLVALERLRTVPTGETTEDDRDEQMENAQVKLDAAAAMLTAHSATANELVNELDDATKRDR